MSTAYIILAQTGEPPDTAWSEIGTTTASSAAAAIRRALHEGPDGDAPDVPHATYVAIPVRSWKPIRATITRVERVHLETL